MGSAVPDSSVHTVQLLPTNPDHVLVCTKTYQAYLMTLQGKLIKTFSSGKQTGGDFTCATVSPQG